MPDEFDQMAPRYEEMLSDPLRDRFTASNSDFFHLRKRDLIRDYFHSRGIDMRPSSYLDVGCGKGELLSLLRDDFAAVSGCDTSWRMLSCVRDTAVRLQLRSDQLPFETGVFDFISASCVYHHVPPSGRRALTAEVKRLLRPAGIFAIIEHNPYNPITRLVVKRSAIDRDAVLLRAFEVRQLMRAVGLTPETTEYFLYAPKPLYHRGGRYLEHCLSSLPLGGQYAVFGTAPNRANG
jgi:SAM-dependent methyltransferase